MNGNPDRSRLIGNGACNRLSDPPRSIRTEFITFAIIKFFNGFHQAHVSFLDQIKEQHTASDIPFCDTDNKPQVRFSQSAFRFFVTFFNLLSVGDFFFAERRLTRPISFKYIRTGSLILTPGGTLRSLRSNSSSALAKFAEY